MYECTRLPHNSGAIKTHAQAADSLHLVFSCKVPCLAEIESIRDGEARLSVMLRT